MLRYHLATPNWRGSVSFVLKANYSCAKGSFNLVNSFNCFLYSFPFLKITVSPAEFYSISPLKCLLTITKS